jgi:hypothetical protein
VALKIEVSGLSAATAATLHHTKSHNAAFLTQSLGSSVSEMSYIKKFWLQYDIANALTWFREVSCRLLTLTLVTSVR